MQKVVNTAQMREIDRLTTDECGISSLQLMEQAAQTVTDALLIGDSDPGLVVLVFCGPGNNGGDGAAIARQLLNAGAVVTLVLTKPLNEIKGDARTNFDLAFELSEQDLPDGYLEFFQCTDEFEWEELREHLDGLKPDLVVDALFGTGLTRPVTGHYIAICEYISALSVAPPDDQPIVFSVDLPSGINSDSNEIIGPHVHSHVTVSFTAPKVANALPPASHASDDLIVTDIGSPRSLLGRFESKLYLTEKSDVVDWLSSTRYTIGSFKNSHGHVLLIAGSRDYLGAPVLCGDAAMRSGAGLVTVATPASAMFGVAPRLMPEVITATLAETDGGAVSFESRHQIEKLAERATVIAVGPGLTANDESTRKLVRWLVESRRHPLVIDADGLNALAPWPTELRGTDELPIVLTPHLGEMRRLLGDDDLGPRPWERAAALAEAQNLIVVLKGERTMTIAPTGDIFVSTTGNPGVGTAGAGDTMTGVIAGFIAQDVGTNKQNAAIVDAVRSAVYLCGMAADLAADDLGMRSMVASDIRKYLGKAIYEIAPDLELP